MHDDRAAELDMSEHRRIVLDHFIGTLCVDELHLGRFTLFRATDPLADLPVAFALVDENDSRSHAPVPPEPQDPGFFYQGRGHRRLEPLPRPAVLAELWPEADHQLCLFHVLKRIHGLILHSALCQN